MKKKTYLNRTEMILFTLGVIYIAILFIRLAMLLALRNATILQIDHGFDIVQKSVIAPFFIGAVVGYFWSRSAGAGVKI